MQSPIPLDPTLWRTRRHFFQDCGVGLGAMALGNLLADGQMFAGTSARTSNSSSPQPAHHPAKAKRVIYLFMAGGPSQLELLDNKPRLQELNGKPIPESYIKGKRFAFMNTFTKEVPKLLASRRKFARYGESGAEISECLPHLRNVADDITIVRSMVTDSFNHGPAKIFMNTGSPQFGRPSMGAWVLYGIGSESKDLPGFVVLQSGPRGPRGGSPNWGSGFLPTSYQGVPFRNKGEPILNLTNPADVSADSQRHVLDTVRDLNSARLEETGDPEISTRIASYEMAFRMQTSAPELIDLSGETEQTLKLYGAEPGKVSFANNCLLARRLIERGARFVQLYHTDWDHHGAGINTLEEGLELRCRETDQASAALIADLKQRGLLDDTLVIWGGEFGRTPMGEMLEVVGRNHHIDAYSLWMAGGGVKAGQTIGMTDELGFSVVSDRVHVHDLQATILHLLGIDHKKLTYKYQGRDFRLTDVHGNVVQKLLA